MFGVEKLEWCGYPMVKKMCEDMFIRFDMIHERDRRTDRHRMPTYAALMHMHRAIKTALYVC